MFWNHKEIKAFKVYNPFQPKDTPDPNASSQCCRHSRLVILTHWSFAAGVVILLLSGLYIGRQIGFRWIFANLKQAQVAHFYAAFGTSFVFLLRVGYAFRSGDWRNIAFSLADLYKLPAMLAYTFFLRPVTPSYRKYNPLQKLVYTGWFFLFLILALTGFINYFQSQTLWIQRFLPLELIPVIKSYGSIIFLVTIILHIYLGLFEDYDLLRAIFTGYTRDCNKADPILLKNNGKRGDS
jgi:Ni/Fe-hydrogenase 1 B-type cytochrome subunit